MMVMKYNASSASLLVLALTSIAVQGSNNVLVVNNDNDVSNDMKHLFHQWRKEFGVAYKTVEEGAERMQIWFQNHGALFIRLRSLSISLGSLFFAFFVLVDR